MNKLLGLELEGSESLEFDLMLHVATVLSTMVVLWKEFMPLCRSFFTLRDDSNMRYVLKILVSCIPVAIVGLCFKDFVESFFGARLTVVGICLCVTACLLAFSYFYRTSPATARAYQPRDITWLDALVIGCAQAIAVLPGLSRSGATIATGILIGDKRETVAQFSFFMVIIPILGQGLLDLKDMLMPDAVAEAQAAVGFLPIVVGFLASFLTGCLACKWMLNLVKKGKLVWFSIYCLVVGVLCLVLG